MNPVRFYLSRLGTIVQTRLHAAFFGGICCVILGGMLITPSAVAQNESEHQSHHPGNTAAATAPSTDSVSGMASPPSAETGSRNTSAVVSSSPDAPMGMPSGMMEAMGKMMEGMMAGGARKEIYPLLMSTPSLTPEKRTEVELLAEERIHGGMLLLQIAQTRLSHAIEAGDHDAAEQALQLNREGNAQVASGVAAHRLIWEGSLPQKVASQWFLQNMGLAPSESNPHGFFGLSWFHYAAMVFLFALAVSMVGIYFYKSTRAAALLTKLSAQMPSDKAIPSVASNLREISHTAAENGAVKPASSEGAGVPHTKPAPINPDITPSKPNAWSGPLLVARIFQETPRVKTFRLIDPAGGTLPFNFLPGQFLTFTVSPHGKSIKRSYTIASSPTHRDFCEVTVRHEDQGVVSSYLNDRVHEGELLQVTGPSGKFTFAGQDGDSIVLIGGGVGITPMMSVVRYLTDRSWPGDIFFIYCCKSDEEVIFREEIEYLKRRYANLHVTLAVTHADPARWPYPIGRITKEGLLAAVPDLPSRHIHLCGPKSMMDGVKLMLVELGVQAHQIEVEVFVGKELPQKADAAALLSKADAADTPHNISTGISPADTSTLASTVTFVRSNKTAPLLPSQTLLEAAESVGVNIEYSCRTGTCGVCKITLLSGAVTMEVEDGLEPTDKEQNLILACQGRATVDVSVDA